MIRIGNRCKLGKFEILGYGEIVIGDDVTISDGVVINVKKSLCIGNRSIIGPDFEISGVDIKIGDEFWSGKHCQIGGGSCFEKPSKLTIGFQCHLGNYGSINTARAVLIANEVGLGEGTKIYTHGAYPNYFRGGPVEFGPVMIGEYVWCPNAIILPNVIIGHDTVVGAGAVVTKSLPAGCLAAGVPAKVIKENVFPKIPSDDEFKQMLNKFVEHFKTNIWTKPFDVRILEKRVFINGRLTLFDFENQKIDGSVTDLTERFRNELRRWGVRFKYYPKGDIYVPW